jgi:DNA polymerase-1
MRLAFDIETDGLLREVTKIHCIVARDIDTDEEYRWDNGDIKRGLAFLLCADELWGHNIVGYDYQAIREIYPKWVYKGTTYDTLILSRLFFTDLLDRDFRSRPANMPANLYGRHSLESWGHRLGVHKSEFGKSLEGDWSTYTPEMLEYCAQDVVVSVAVAKMFQSKLEIYKDCIDTEHRIADLMAWQERMGFPFDVDKAHQLESKLRTELDSISEEMRNTFTFVDGGQFTPKRDNGPRGYVAGSAMCKLKEFSPTSRDHIAWAFETFRNWEPKERTASGRAKIDDSVLKEIGTEEALKFSRILELQKHLGQLSEGKNAWLKQEINGRIHHSCILNTNTGRMAHLRPNLAQVPSAPEYRELFYPGKDRVQVGADASGLELRCLGHYLAPFDNSKFAKEVVEGDIHTELAKIYGTDRKSGKGVTYCLIYGGGDMKLGLTAGASKRHAAAKGKEIRKRIMEGLDGFAELSAAIQKRAEGDVLRGIDGRPIRLQGKRHAALNYLLQSAGAVICKLWVIRANELLQEMGIDYWPMAFVHDELQLSVSPSQVSEAELLITAAMKDVEHQLKFRCALDSEAQHGASWADCH